MIYAYGTDEWHRDRIKRKHKERRKSLIKQEMEYAALVRREDVDHKRRLVLSAMMDSPQTDALMINMPADVREILQAVAVEQGYFPRRLLIKARMDTKPCDVRFELTYRIVKDTTYSMNEIGKILGVDHTTVIHRVQSYCAAHGVPLPRPMNKKLRYPRRK